MFEKILFATDLTPVSKNANDYVVQIASRFGSEVVVLHAIEAVRTLHDEKSDEFRILYDALQTEASEKGRGVLTDFDAAGVKARLETGVGKRWEVVVKAAAAEQADLIVMGSHERRDGEKVYVGSTSHKVFLMAQCPVLVVR